MGSAPGGVTRNAKRHVDILPAMAADHGWFTDKPEGATVLGSGQVKHKGNTKNAQKKIYGTGSVDRAY